VAGQRSPDIVLACQVYLIQTILAVPLLLLAALVSVTVGIYIFLQVGLLLAARSV
jgi:hypothetical protein